VHIFPLLGLCYAVKVHTGFPESKWSFTSDSYNDSAVKQVSADSELPGLTYHNFTVKRTG
jgi:hypothetical protein